MDASDQLKQDVRQGRIDVDRLVDLFVTLQQEMQTTQQQLQATHQQLEAAKQRIAELEKKLGDTTTKVNEPFSMRAEEKRQDQRRDKKKRQLSKKGRRGRLSSADKVQLAERTE